MIKKPHKKRRRKATMSAPATRRRRKHHKKGSLSDMFNPTIAMNSAKSTLLASGGGLLSMVVNKSILPANAGKVARIGTALIGGFVASAFGMQQIGSGFAGGMIALTFQNGLLAEKKRASGEAKITKAQAKQTKAERGGGNQGMDIFNKVVDTAKEFIPRKQGAGGEEESAQITTTAKQLPEQSDTITIFGKEIKKTTAYIGGGLGILALLGIGYAVTHKKK